MCILNHLLRFPPTGRSDSRPRPRPRRRGWDRRDTGGCVPPGNGREQHRRGYRTCLFIAGLFAVGAIGAPTTAQEPTVDVIFLDVGQGDAVLIRSAGRTVLIDGGPSSSIVPLLQRLGVQSLDLVIASHPHADHIGGLRAVFRAFPVSNYLDNGSAHTTRTYASLMGAVERSDATYLQPTERSITLGAATLQIIPPPVDFDDQNNRSVGVLLELGEFRALFTGDSEVGEINYFLARGMPTIGLLKAAHHGARNGVTPRWISVLQPDVVVIQVGAGNQYGHPDPQALRYYATGNRTILRTDLEGTIVLRGYASGEIERIGLDRAVTIPQANKPVTSRASVSLDIVADAPGNDHNNLNGEYAILRNNNSMPLEIFGWTLCDAASHCYTFPSGAVIHANGMVSLYTGAGRSGGRAFFMGRRQAVWNNRGDTATLTDAAGRLVTRYAY